MIVRGPAPSCRVAGYIPVRGHKGENKVNFSGRVQGRRLEPGIYLISLSPNRSFVPGAATEYVRVLSPRRSVPLPESTRKPSSCGDAGAALPVYTTAWLAFAEAKPQSSAATPTVRPTPAQPKTKAAGPTGSKDDEETAGFGFIPDSGVLGAATGDGTGQPFLAVAVLSLVAALLIAMVALVTRFLRGSWNP